MATPHHGPAHRRRVFRHGLARAGAIAGALVGLSLLMNHVLHAFHAEHDAKDGK